MLFLIIVKFILPELLRNMRQKCKVSRSEIVMFLAPKLLRRGYQNCEVGQVCGTLSICCCRINQVCLRVRMRRKPAHRADWWCARLRTIQLLQLRKF